MNDHLVGDDGYQAEAAMEPPLTITNRDLDIELDPLDYFVIIKKLITQSLSANEIGILEAANVQGVDLEFPSDLGQHISAAPHGELEVEKTDLEEKLAALQLTIDEYEERSVKDSSALQQAVADARSTELELKDLREKFGSLTAGANEAKDVAEKKATEAWLELAELREKCGSLRALVDAVKQQKDSAEKETSKVKVAKGRADTELEALRVQIGTPSASDKEKPDFMQYMTENTKVELVSRILQFMPLREALDNSQKEMAAMKSSIGILKEEYNGVRNQRDTALTEVQRIKKEGQRVLDQIQETRALAAVKTKTEELEAVKETLAFERAEFRRFRDTAESRAKRLQQEAARAEELEDQLAKRALRLRQKEAEARALAADRKIVRNLRENLSSKDDSLSALRRELEDARAAAADQKKAAEKQEAQLSTLAALRQEVQDIRAASTESERRANTEQEAQRGTLATLREELQITRASAAEKERRAEEEAMMQRSTIAALTRELQDIRAATAERDRLAEEQVAAQSVSMLRVVVAARAAAACAAECEDVTVVPAEEDRPLCAACGETLGEPRLRSVSLEEVDVDASPRAIDERRSDAESVAVDGHEDAGTGDGDSEEDDAEDEREEEDVKWAEGHVSRIEDDHECDSEIEGVGGSAGAVQRPLSPVLDVARSSLAEWEDDMMSSESGYEAEGYYEDQEEEDDSDEEDDEDDESASESQYSEDESTMSSEDDHTMEREDDDHAVAGESEDDGGSEGKGGSDAAHDVNPDIVEDHAEGEYEDDGMLVHDEASVEDSEHNFTENGDVASRVDYDEESIDESSEDINPNDISDVSAPVEAAEASSLQEETETEEIGAFSPTVGSRYRPRLSLEKGKYAETDEEAAAFVEASFGSVEPHIPLSTGRAAGALGSLWGERRSRGAGVAHAYSRSMSVGASPLPQGSVSGTISPAGPDRGSAGRVVPLPSPCATGYVEPMEHGLQASQKTVVIELGTYRVRAGVLEQVPGGEGKSFFDDFACCVARPRIQGADLNDLVSGASSLAAPMYQRFRETGVFVGGDAWYCTMNHPDSALRSKLRLSSPMEQGRVRPRNGESTGDDVEKLLDHCFSILKQDSSCSPTFVTYKPTATPEEVWDLAAALFEVQRVPAVRLINEALLAALATGIKNGILVDVGESGVSVTPIFEGFPVSRASQWESCGGGDMSRYLDHMLVDRRRLEYARSIKEGHCFISSDFKEEAKRKGLFRRKTMRVFQGAQVSPKLANYQACSVQEFMEDNVGEDAVTVRLPRKSGEDVELTLGRERFHAPELLFSPDLWDECSGKCGVCDLILQALESVDADVRVSMVENIVITGGSSALPGLAPRLRYELQTTTPSHLRQRIIVRVVKPQDLTHSNPSSRAVPSAVTIGAEALLRSENGSKFGWIDMEDWENDSDVIRRQWYLL